jgi:hypothetical protein
MPSRIPFSNLMSIQFLPQVFHILEIQYFVYIVFIVLSILSSSFNFQFFLFDSVFEMFWRKLMSTFQSFEIDRDRDPHSSRKMMLIRPEPDPFHANLGKFGMCRNLYPGVPPDFNVFLLMLDPDPEPCLLTLLHTRRVPV